LFGEASVGGIGIWYFFKRPVALDARLQDRGSAYSDIRSTFLLTLTKSDDGAVFLALLAALGMGSEALVAGPCFW